METRSLSAPCGNEVCPAGSSLSSGRPGGSARSPVNTCRPERGRRGLRCRVSRCERNAWQAAPVRPKMPGSAWMKGRLNMRLKLVSSRGATLRLIDLDPASATDLTQREFSRRRQRRPAAIQLYARDDALLRPHAARRGKGDRPPARDIPGGGLAKRRLCEGCVAPRTTAKWAATWPLASSGAKEGSSEGS